MPQPRPATKQCQGFTLIQGATVLLVVGLMASALLVGEHVVKAAATRLTIGQIEDYSIATHSFRVKYNALPGDMLRRNATSLGLCPDMGCPGREGNGLGDANGLLTDAQPVNTNSPSGEILAFWLQLSMSGFIDDELGRDMSSGYTLGANPVAEKYFPRAYVGRENYFMVGSASKSNYFGLINIVSLSSPGIMLGGTLSPKEAYSIDSKLDDGKPNTGDIQARKPLANLREYYGKLKPANAASWDQPPNEGYASLGACMTGTSAMDKNNTYNVKDKRQTPLGAAPSCALTMRME